MKGSMRVSLLIRQANRNSRLARDAGRIRSRRFPASRGRCQC